MAPITIKLSDAEPFVRINLSYDELLRLGKVLYLFNNDATPDDISTLQEDMKFVNELGAKIGLAFLDDKGCFFGGEQYGDH